MRVFQRRIETNMKNTKTNKNGAEQATSSAGVKKTF